MLDNIALKYGIKRLFIRIPLPFGWKIEIIETDSHLRKRIIKIKTKKGCKYQ